MIFQLCLKTLNLTFEYTTSYVYFFCEKTDTYWFILLTVEILTSKIENKYRKGKRITKAK